MFTFMRNLLGDAAPMPLWVINSFPVLRLILMIVIGICAIALIIVVLCQESESNGGATALTGAETYYSQNKGRSRDGMLKRATIILSIVIVSCVVVYFILTAIYGGKL